MRRLFRLQIWLSEVRFRERVNDMPDPVRNRSVEFQNYVSVFVLRDVGFFRDMEVLDCPGIFPFVRDGNRGIV